MKHLFYLAFSTDFKTKTNVKNWEHMWTADKKYFRFLEINYENIMANSKLPTDQQAALISISSQGNLLTGTYWQMAGCGVQSPKESFWQQFQ